MEIIEEKINIPQKYFFIILAIVLINISLLSFFLRDFTAPFSSDSTEYVEAARYLKGEGSLIDGRRLLKPLFPALIALGSYFTEEANVFLLVNSIFYFLIGFLVYKIVQSLFKNEFQALIASVFFLTAYPMLEYGVTYMTDLSGWFFYVLSVYLIICFLKQPSSGLAALIGFISFIGVLFKETGAVGGIFFIIGVIFILKDSFFNKLKYLFFCGLTFGVPFLSWQALFYIKYHYSYFNWYAINSPSQAGFGANVVRDTIKSLAAVFMLGWAFVLIGLRNFRELSSDHKKIIYALIPSSFSFLLWASDSSRIYYISGVLLCLLASWGFVKIAEKSRRYDLINSMLVIAIASNYFWLIYDNRLRSIIKKLFDFII